MKHFFLEISHLEQLLTVISRYPRTKRTKNVEDRTRTTKIWKIPVCRSLRLTKVLLSYFKTFLVWNSKFFENLRRRFWNSANLKKKMFLVTRFLVFGGFSKIKSSKSRNWVILNFRSLIYVPLNIPVVTSVCCRLWLVVPFLHLRVSFLRIGVSF